MLAKSTVILQKIKQPQTAQSNGSKREMFNILIAVGQPNQLCWLNKASTASSGTQLVTIKAWYASLNVVKNTPSLS